MINNRQNGRRRGRGNNNGGGGNGQRSGNMGRPDSGNRIDSRARGNANQLYEKYKNLARDAQMSGDRVNTEYYLQFADHYFRVLSETRMRFEEQNPNAPQQRRIQPVDSFDDFDEGDDEGYEGEPIRAGEQQAGQGVQEPRSDQGQRGQRDGRDRDGRDREGRDRDGRDNGQRQQGQQGQPRYEGRRDERYEGARRNGNGHPGDEGARDDQREVAEPRYAAMTSPVANDMGNGSPDGSSGAEAAEPRRRGRPRRAAPDEAGAPEAPASLDADRLPPSLSVVGGADESGDGEEAPRPRRRRVRAAGEATPLG